MSMVSDPALTEVKSEAVVTVRVGVSLRRDTGHRKVLPATPAAASAKTIARAGVVAVSVRAIADRQDCGRIASETRDGCQGCEQDGCASGDVLGTFKGCRSQRHHR